MASIATPSTSTSLLRLASPPAMRTAERGTSSRPASSLTSASLAAPSTGGAARRTFSASPWRPTTSLRDARGCTRTENRTLSPRCVTESTPRPGRASTSEHVDEADEQRADHPLEQEPRDDRREVEHPERREHAAQRTEDRLRQAVRPAHPRRERGHPEERRD